MIIFIVLITIFASYRLLEYLTNISHLNQINYIFYFIVLFIIIYPFTIGKGYKIKTYSIKYNLNNIELILMGSFLIIISLQKNLIISLIFLLTTFISLRGKK